MQKSFDCVKMMRDIRAGLSKRYAEHPELLEEDMARIRRKYAFPERARRIQRLHVTDGKTVCSATSRTRT